MTVGVLYRQELREYDFGEGHPFRGDRYEIFPQFLKERVPQNDNYTMLQAGYCSEEDLLLICNQDYIEFTSEYYKAANLGEKYARSFEFPKYQSMDNLPRTRPGKLEEAARLMIGQVRLAADLIQEGRHEKLVCIGGNLHHAMPDHGEGFCLYNDNAYMAKYLMRHHGLERILILDTDAHQGNGTCQYFAGDPRVLMIDLHQHPSTLYPGTGLAADVGEGDGRGYTINVPLPVHAGPDSYRLVFEEVVKPSAQEFKPQLIIRNGGSDPHFADDLTNLGLTVAGFRMIGEQVREMSQLCGGREVEVVGSGYNKQVLPYAWLAVMSGAVGFQVELEEPVPVPEQYQTDSLVEETKQAVKEVKRYQGDYWSCFRSS